MSSTSVSWIHVSGEWVESLPSRGSTVMALGRLSRVLGSFPAGDNNIRNNFPAGGIH